MSLPSLSRIRSRLLKWITSVIVILLLLLNMQNWQQDKKIQNLSKTRPPFISPPFRISNLQTSSPRMKNILIYTEKSYSATVLKRRALIDSHPELINPWKSAPYFFDYFLPAFSCPYTTQRVGKMGDGGKWVCGMELFEININYGDAGSGNGSHPKPCILYSFGINDDDSSFEAEILNRTNCEIFAFDAKVNKMGAQIPTKRECISRHHFNKVVLGIQNDFIKNVKTLKSLMSENEHDWIDILKMDIEGAEFAVLDQMLNEFPEGLPFGQIQIEFHPDKNGLEALPDSFPLFYKLWERLEDAGLRPFMNEFNLVRSVEQKSLPNLIEYSFINLNSGDRNRIIQ